MKSINFFKGLLFCASLIFIGCEQPEEQVERCGAGEYFQQQMATNPDFRSNHLRIEGLIEDYYNTVPQGEAGLRGGRIIIPVVVHVLHNGEDTGVGTNISDAQIQSQIDVMNADFRRLNADITNVPSAFSGVTADSRIEFQLARRDPGCNATNGITRQRAGRVKYLAREAKSSTTGGVDPWDTDKYLNMWIVDELYRIKRDGTEDLSVFGSSSFPASPADEQGFVCESNVFGNIGTGASRPSFNGGRTAVHEFGHFFNLLHIWGDDSDGRAACDATVECSGSDEVDDTPNAGAQNFGTPAFPLTDCCTDGNGVMFMNYMDYVDDQAMIMFTQGQVDRMIASLYTTKASLIGSDGLLPPSEGSRADLYIQDTPEDIGNEPNNESDRFYISQDIWVRNSPGTTNQEHENPAYAVGSRVWVYVRVRNNGCATSPDANVKLYWAKASSGLSWQAPWDGSVSIAGAPMGGEVGVKSTGAIIGGGFTILEYEWSIPNPSDYASFGADSTHFCLLARIESSAGMTFPETSNLHENVQNNNNIAWKNLDIMGRAGSAGGRSATIMVGNYETGREYDITLAFENASDREASVFDYGDVFMELSKELMAKWTASGSQGEGVTQVGANRIQINRAGATIKGVLLNPKEIYACQVICQKRQPALGPRVYMLDLIQFEGDPSANRKIGGQRFVLESWNR